MNKKNIKFEVLQVVRTVANILIDKEYVRYIIISDAVKVDSKEIRVRKTLML